MPCGATSDDSVPVQPLCLRRRLVAEEVGAEGLLLGDLILSEVLRGFKDDRSCNETKRRLAILEQLSLCGEEIATAAARNFKKLLIRSVTVRGTVDVIIATHGLDHGHRLLRSDHDFGELESHLGLQVVNCEV